MSTFGRNFRVTTFGESHCQAVGCIVDGVPPQMPLTEDDIQPQLTRRRPGQSKLTTPRDEKDRVKILSGTERGLTLGTPIGMVVMNEDQRPGDYKEMSTVPRPSHADFTYIEKYGIHSASGGGRASARETIGRVAAGAVAENWLRLHFGIEIVAFVCGVGGVEVPLTDSLLASVTRDAVDSHIIRCPDKAACEEMAKLVLEASQDHDSVGGRVACVVRNVPSGWGEPSFDKLEALLAHAMLSIPATKGFEVGSGFKGSEGRGHWHNDPFCKLSCGRLGTTTNHSGGIQGGITNGMPIYFRVAFKPPATIGLQQPTVDFDGQDGVLEAKGRHDPCVVPRAVPIVEAMTALVLADVALSQAARQASVHSSDIFTSMRQVNSSRE